MRRDVILLIFPLGRQVFEPMLDGRGIAIAELITLAKAHSFTSLVTLGQDIFVEPFGELDVCSRSLEHDIPGMSGAGNPGSGINLDAEGDYSDPWRNLLGIFLSGSAGSGLGLSQVY